MPSRPAREHHTALRPNPEPALQSTPRLLALLRTLLLDTPPEEAYDRLTELAASMLDVPFALFTLLDDRRQFVKSQCGHFADPNNPNGPLSHSFCKYVVATGAPLVVSDSRRHPWVYDNPAVLESNVIAYLGVPIRGENGQVVGALCALDTEPHVWAEQDIRMLQHVAFTVMMYIGLNTTLHSTRWQHATAEHERAASQAVLEASCEGILSVDRAGNCTYINSLGAVLLGVTAEEVVGRSIGELLARMEGVDETEHPVARALLSVLDEGTSVLEAELVLTVAHGKRVPVVYSITPLTTAQSITGAVLCVRDITGRNRSRRLLALEAAFGRARVESATAHGALGQMMQILGEAMEWDWCALWIPDPYAGVLRCGYSWASPPIARRHLLRAATLAKVEYGKTPLGQAWRNNRSERIELMEPPDASDPWRATCFAAGLRGGACVVLRGQMGIVGVLECFTTRTQPFDERELKILPQIRLHLTRALERRTLELNNYERGTFTAAIFEHAPNGIVLLDDGGTILDANPVAEQFLHRPLPSLVGTRVDLLLRDPQNAETLSALGLSEDLASGAPKRWRGHLTFLHPDGTPLPLAVTGIPYTGGPVARMVVLEQQ